MMTNAEILSQNKASWDAIADSWFGTTALPEYGIFMPTEDELCLFGDVNDKKVLDIGCGSGHSLKWMGGQGASELWGLDLSTHQLENAERFLRENGYSPRLLNHSMEEDSGIPRGYFDIAYSIYAIGWTTDLQTTFDLVASYLKPGGIFVFSWDHPFMHCVSVEGERLIFDGSYFDEGLFTFEKGGCPMSLYNRKLSTYINALAKAGFAVELVVEETTSDLLKRNVEFSSAYYAPSKAKMFPLSFAVKARKL